jgi:hypothetical protein
VKTVHAKSLFKTFEADKPRVREEKRKAPDIPRVRKEKRKASDKSARKEEEKRKAPDKPRVRKEKGKAPDEPASKEEEKRKAPDKPRVRKEKRKAPDKPARKEKRKAPAKPKRTVHKESGCESCKTLGKPIHLIARNLQWWCDSCLRQPDLKRVFKCCLKKSCPNTQEFSVGEYRHSSWRCGDCKDKRNRELRVIYSRKKERSSSDKDEKRDDSPRAQEGRAKRRKRRHAERGE